MWVFLDQFSKARFNVFGGLFHYIVYLRVGFDGRQRYIGFWRSIADRLGVVETTAPIHVWRSQHFRW
tara:strand:- start:2681 stop:2881 length:201 start_codon:yes stop_codon:yes gene_type:complete